MSGAKYSFKIDKKTQRRFETELAKMEVVGRNKAIQKGARESGKPPKQRWMQLIPTSGKWAKPMSKTISIKTEPLRKGSGYYVKVRSTARHAHLPELGHIQVSHKDSDGAVRKLGIVYGKLYGLQAARETHSQSKALAVAGIKKAVKEATGQ